MMQTKAAQTSRFRWVSAGLSIGLLVLVFLNVSTGPVEISWGNLFSEGFSSQDQVVLLSIRLPRVCLAILVGASLGVAGTALQGLFRNPLADPGLIGVSSGGAIGAMIGILCSGLVSATIPLLAGLQIPLFAMLGGVLTTLAIYRLAQIGGRTHVTTLLLGGIAINAMAGAIVGSMLYLSDNTALRQFTFWTLGSLHRASWENLGYLLPFTLLPLILLPRAAQALNAFLLGEGQAFHLGIRIQRVKRQIIILSAAMVGATVAMCGLIGFVGLVVPHIMRLAVGPDHHKLFPLSMLSGACLMLIADLVSRTANPPTEVPIGILTALLGAPFFLYLIQRRKRSISW